MEGKIAVLGDTDFVMPFSALGVDTFATERAPQKINENAKKILDGKYTLVIVAENIAHLVEEVFSDYQGLPTPCIIVVPFTTEPTGLAIRRIVTNKPLGTDYSSDGNVPPEQLKEAFEQEKYSLLPDYMQQAAEQAVLTYYQSRDPALREQKDIKQIDFTIDTLQAEFNLKVAQKLKNIFLLGLFRIQIDLINIRTMFRLKFTKSEQEPRLAAAQRNVFLYGGFIELERLFHGLDLGYEGLEALFFVTPYHRVVEAGAGYLASNKSFLKLEQQCDDFLTGFLKSTLQITAGPQPIIAYLLMKENEIRTVRLILTAKKNFLDTKLIQDRIS